MFKKILTVLVILITVGPGLGVTKSYAASHLTLFTPYTGLAVTPGETINYSIDVTNSSSSIESITFDVNNLPDGFEQSITSGGRDIRQLSIKPNGEETINLEVTVPLKVQKADYRFELVANGADGTVASLDFLTTVTEQGTFKTELTSDQPNMEGYADSTFSYSAKIRNRTAEKQTYALSTKAPEGWSVQFKVDGQNVTSVTLDPNSSKDISINMTPAQNVTADTYTIPIQASTSNTTAEATLEAVITGSYDINLTTKDGRLSTDITAGNDKTIDLVVENTGTTTLTDIDITASTPPNWESEFDISTIPQLAAGESKTIKATLTAPDDAIAGDYVTTFTAETAQASSDASFRVSVATSTVWGFIGVLIILAVVFGLYYLIRKYGRR
ncbi:NEW3 domain-containing protein [Aquibacillus salsiterrae]|uniref:NEW3 domain-containing protein n=1 Tax=Aquibacillus salsiterrae TaxID=2950439 RepID=A0A9X3WJF9_9BACI|nr:NEW3 domain-containing protein [Aquibacillus salsiterrae]MDC3418529.1 NEW3 domain-containing protein [Aquibacillus salsiterrae]